MFTRVKKFKDGTYGVQRFSLNLFCWEMLDLNYADEWYITKEFQIKYCRGTKAVALWALYKWNNNQKLKK